MRTLQYLSFLTILLSSGEIIAGHGGDVYIQNDTPFIIEKSGMVQGEGLDHLSPPDKIGSDEKKGIYLEVSSSKPQSYESYSTITYSVTCPDNEKDQFKIKFKIGFVNDHSLIPIEIIPFGRDPHCINLDGNTNVVWKWNQWRKCDRYGGDCPPPIKDTFVIHQM